MFFFLSDQSEHGEKAYPRVDGTTDEVVRNIFLFCFVFGQKSWKIKSQADKDHLVSELGCQEGKLTESGSS